MTVSSTSPHPLIEIDIAAEDEPVCVHHWIIDIPSGPVSNGRCRLCGETREFRNYLETFSGWDDVRTFGQSSRGESGLLGVAVESEEEE